MPVLLALDVGQRRIGVAAGSTESGLARPHHVWRVTGESTRESTARRIQQLADELGAAALVVGLPLQEDGTLSDQGLRIRRHIQAIAPHIDLPVIFWNERLSTQEAQALLLETARGPRRRRCMEDAVAAAVILQDYLDTQRGASQHGTKSTAV